MVGRLGSQRQRPVPGGEILPAVDAREGRFVETGGNGVEVCNTSQDSELLPNTELTIKPHSVGAHLTTPSLSAYQPSKLAVLRLTQFIDAEYSAQNVTAITIHPGNILTEMATSGDIPDELHFVFTESADLPADTIVWLTAEKRDWLGGRYVNVTWDMVELEARREEVLGGDRLKVKLDVDF